MARSLTTISREVAGQVLAMQRGMNTPQRRIELAVEIEAAIESYLAFEKRKARQRLRKEE